MLLYKIKTKHVWQLLAQKIIFKTPTEVSWGEALIGPCEMAFEVQFLETFAKGKPLDFGKESQAFGMSCILLRAGGGA